MAITWEAISEQWPWFAAAAGVLVVVIGLLILLKPKSKRQPKTTGNASDSKEWVLTGRIDFVDPRSAGELVLQVEETRIVNRPSGLSIEKFVGEGDIRRRQDGVGLLPCPTKSFDVREFHGKCTYQDEAKCKRSERGGRRYIER